MELRTKGLDRLRPGESGRVVEIAGKGAVRQRLLEMGLIEGTEVEVVRSAPLGDPIEVELHSYLLSLRKAEAAAVTIEMTR